MTAEAAVPERMYADAEAFLSAADPAMAALISRAGPCGLKGDATEDPFAALLRAVVYQQLHGRAAAAILGRVCALTAGERPSPAQLLAHDGDVLRACGLSARKVETLQGLARARLEGMVPSAEEAAGMSDEELTERLTQLRGIGRWTVEMLLIFTLRRPDVMPVDDLGVAEGWRRIRGDEARLTPRRLREATMHLAPWRSVAAWYLWRASEEGRKRSGANPVTGG